MFLNFFFNIFAIKIQMIEIDKKLHKDIKEYCQLNGLIMKDFVNKLLKKAFMVEKYGDKPFSSNNVVVTPYVPTLEVTIEEPANLPPITNEKILEKYRKPFAEPEMSNLEKEAIEKIKDMVESQVDLPIEIAEAMEEVDFFELLGEEKNEVQAILPVDYKMPEPIKPIIKPENMQNASPIKTESVQEEIKVVRKKKRKLS